MRRIICLFILFLTGCQGLTTVNRVEEPPASSIMPLWERYQQCVAAMDPERLLPIVEQFEQVMLAGPEPPAWLKSWGQQVKRQPLRTAVDPYALGAACTIRTAQVMVERNRMSEARALYERVLSRYPRQEWAYYHEQAKDALASLPTIDPALIALRRVSTAPFAR